MRYFSALFRLSFRHPEKMHYADSDRDLVVDYLERTFRVTREFIGKGLYPAEYAEVAVEAVQRMKEWKQSRAHQEL